MFLPGGEKLDVSFGILLGEGVVAMPLALFAALNGAVLMPVLVGLH
jgi:arsenical pump membrane protein